MIKESGLYLPNRIKGENFLLQADYLLPVCDQVDKLFGDILQVLVAAVVIDHAFYDPLVFDFLVEVAAVDSLVEGIQIGVEDRPIPIFDFGVDVLKDMEGFYLYHIDLDLH